MATGRRPPRQYLSADHVLGELCQFGSRRLKQLSVSQVLVLGVMGGGFIAMGALLSVLLAEGAGGEGAKRLVEGLGFSSGFFFVVLSEAVLFTEANVAHPAVLLFRRPSDVALTVGGFWLLAWLGNLAGAWLVGQLLSLAQKLPHGALEEIQALVTRKMVYGSMGTTEAWLLAILSGILANWLVGMAAFFATMGRSIIGKYIPVLLAVTVFVAAGLEHSPANMGFFALATPLGLGSGWLRALAWNIVPVGIGNMIGGALLVALPFWYALRPEERKSLTENLETD